VMTAGFGSLEGDGVLTLALVTPVSLP